MPRIAYELAITLAVWLCVVGVLSLVMWLIWRGLPHVRGIPARPACPEQDPFEGRGPPRSF